MSDLLFPALPGLAFDVVKSPTFATDIRKAVSGKERRRANASAPVYRIGLNYEFMRDEAALDELRTLFGFYTRHAGAADSFLFMDPDDSTATLESLGTGDGVTVSFQPVRTWAGFTEPVANLAAVAEGAGMWAGDPATAPMWADDTSAAAMWADIIYTSADYAIIGGRIVFNAPVPDGAALLWSGSFYYRCRFVDDQLDFTKFMYHLWSLKTCDLLGSPGRKVS